MSLLSLEDARERMLEGVEALPWEEVAIPDALGRVLAEPISSRLTLPPWDNSAMDGFAVLASDVANANDEVPVTLRVIGEAAAGRDPRAAPTVESGTAVRILTGAPMPAGADTVVPVEDTDAQMGVADLPESVEIRSARPPGAHIRRSGSDLTTGMRLLDAGTQLTAAGVSLVAAGGHGAISAYRKPRVAVFATGDELVAPGAPLGPAQIPDSNTVGLVALAESSGAEARSFGVARDTTDSVLKVLREAIEWADIVVASGGVSVGAHDVVKGAFEEVGRIDLWRVAVQPGKPVAFGRAGKTLLFGLPGNPVSSQVTFEIFVRPVLRRLAGFKDLIGRDSVRARLGESVRKAPGRRAFIRVRLVESDQGWRADLSGGQESHMLLALARADGLAIIPEDADSLDEGAEVEVIRLR